MRSEYIILGVLVLLVYSLTGASAANTITSEFLVYGCTQGDVDLAVGECSRDGTLFCNGNGDMQDTVQVEDACDFGDLDGLNYTQGIGTPQCCPSGYLCDENGDMVCGQRIIACSGYINIDSCEADACFWIDDGGSGLCVNTPLDFSCSAYINEIGCTEDFSNLGRIGFGTDVAGDFFTDAPNNDPGNGFVAPRGSFKCFWKGGLQCVLQYEVSEDISLITPSPEFTCQKTFTAGLCNEGSQDINWTVVGRIPVSVDQDLINNSQCTTGADTRSCGDPVVRLPGFSLFALLASIAIIGLFYFFKRE
jgi:hypothetical protein